jgi:hypothetical protein
MTTVSLVVLAQAQVQSNCFLFKKNRREDLNFEDRDRHSSRRPWL